MTLSFGTADYTNPEIIIYYGQGYLIEEDVIEGTNLTIPSAVYADFEPYLDASSFTGACLWSVYVNVTDFNVPEVKSMRTDPPSFQFGSLVHQTRGYVTSKHYLNFESQAFPRQGSMFVPPLYGPVPSSIDQLPEPQLGRLLVPTIQPLSGFLGTYSNLNDFGRENGGLFGATDFRLLLNPSVVANVTVAYFGYATINQSVDPSDVLFFNF